MLDIKYIRENKDKAKKATMDKQIDPKVVDQLLDVDEKRRDLLHKIEVHRAEDRDSEKNRHRRVIAEGSLLEASHELDETRDGDPDAQRDEEPQRVVVPEEVTGHPQSVVGDQVKHRPHQHGTKRPSAEQEKTTDQDEEPRRPVEDVVLQEEPQTPCE